MCKNKKKIKKVRSNGKKNPPQKTKPNLSYGVELTYLFEPVESSYIDRSLLMSTLAEHNIINNNILLRNRCPNS